MRNKEVSLSTNSLYCTGWPDRMKYTVSRTLKYFWLSGRKYFYVFLVRLRGGGLTRGR